jgi:hypothetical protein
MPESVTHVPGLICYLCTWTIPTRRLTSACSGARLSGLTWLGLAESVCNNAPADAPDCVKTRLIYV